MKTLLDKLLSHATLSAAWRRVWENDGGPGADGVTLETFSQSILSELAALKREVRSESYFPGNLREIELPRPGRQPRLLGVPCVRDRVLQTAAALVISPLIDPEFSPESHAYRPGHSVADAIAQVIAARDDGYRWVVDADIEAKFDTPIKHPVNGKTTDLRRAIAAQVQHWAEYVTGRVKVYRPYVLH